LTKLSSLLSLVLYVFETVYFIYIRSFGTLLTIVVDIVGL